MLDFSLNGGCSKRKWRIFRVNVGMALPGLALTGLDLPCLALPGLSWLVISLPGLAWPGPALAGLSSALSDLALPGMD